MRHFLLLCAVCTRALGMFAATSMARLVASARFALRVAPRRLSTILLTVDAAAIAAGADQHLSSAASAQKKSAHVHVLVWLRHTDVDEKHHG
jgi:hypothetical protein